MLISKGAPLLRLLNKPNVVNSIRNMSGHAWGYRGKAADPSKKTIYLAEACGGLMWWWVLWHLWHEHEHITGEFPFPDPRKWTDAELGIPPK